MNITQWPREYIGRLWRLIHDLLKYDPEFEHDAWRAQHAIVKDLVEGFCKTCTTTPEGKRPRRFFRHLHRNHNHTEWRADLDAGYRFLPDLSSKPYGTIREADRTGVNVWVSHHDLRNFNLCLEYHESGAEILDVFPGKIDSKAIQLPTARAIDLPPSTYLGNMTTVVGRIQRDFFDVAQRREVSVQEIQAWRKWSEMRLLATLREENWANVPGYFDHVVGLFDYGPDEYLGTPPRWCSTSLPTATAPTAVATWS